MKKIMSSLLIMLLVAGAAMAQQRENQKEVRQQIAVPLAVLNAIEENSEEFQNRKEIPITYANQHTETEKLGPDFMVLTTSKSVNGRSHKSERALYRADGSFVFSRTVMKNCALPKPALVIIGKEFNQWLLVKTKALIVEKGGKRSVFYKAFLENGKRRESILLNEAGQIVKNKRELKEDAVKAADPIVL